MYFTTIFLKQNKRKKEKDMTLVQASESHCLLSSQALTAFIILSLSFLDFQAHCVCVCVWFFFFLFFSSPHLSLSLSPLSSQYSSNSFVHFIEAVLSLPKHYLQTCILSAQSATIPFLKCFFSFHLAGPRAAVSPT